MYQTKFHSIDLQQIKILVTGGAGFIGSNIVEYLLKYNIGKLRVLDNLSTGYLDNIKDYFNYPNFEFIEGDIRDLETCQVACNDMDYVLHQAALGSVPRSIIDPIATNEVNINGFLNILVAVKDKGVKRIIYAASSSTYGDSQELPKIEERIGKPLSPYAVTKYVNELYADVFARTYGIETVGLRYFNVFGPRQSPNSQYAAVIPLFIEAVKNNKSAYINGDGNQSRDFTFVENVIQANIKALFIDDINAINQIYNIGFNKMTSLIELWGMINLNFGKKIRPLFRDLRQGDIKFSLANIEKAKRLLNYTPQFSLAEGLKLQIKINND